MDDFKSLKSELQNIIKGASEPGQSYSIQAAKAYLRNHTQPGGKTKSSKPDRAEEERALKEYAGDEQLYIQKESLGVFITSGAEQKVYYNENEAELCKISDAVFYENWSDYFDNLLIHNYFFPDTAYTLTGFLTDGDTLFAVVKQSFVLHTENTNLKVVKDYLLANGFIHKKIMIIIILFWGLSWKIFMMRMS